jgi:16S rRNA (guanine527-N7)-methyltransferase
MTDVPRETSLDRGVVGAPGRELRPAPAAAAIAFGSRLAAASHYARLLATDGVTRGLLGPREVPRLWERHLLNCAAVAELIAPGSTVIDVGSGAGLPGIPLALARPDLDIELLDPLLRRAVFLEEVVDALALDRVRVVRGRAEDARAGPGVDVVTARAVAPLSRLAAWCLPLLRPGGSLIALKGSQAPAELDAAAGDLRRLGAVEWGVESCGHDLVDPPTTVVRVVLGEARLPHGGRVGGRGGRRAS